ncbi:ABC transporter substrate-binding protein [Streptomyces sp. NPDC002490]|uniref:ABC transporter substrate-binding protein n=1 Tax=Streptomyces sp. NPDC002490 TaxID=3154416 RepID=UPI0033340D38
MSKTTPVSFTGRSSRRRSRQVYPAVGVALAIAVVSACGSGDSSSSGGGAKGTGGKGMARFGVAVPLNDWETIDRANSTYTALVYEGLVGLAKDGVTIEPKLAKSWKETAKEITFQLEKGVVFQDGTPFDAAAAVKNLERMKASKGQWTSVMAPVTAIEAVGTDQVKISLKSPAPNLVPNLARSQGYMISPKALDAGDWAKKPSGTGPFVYDAGASVAGSKVVAKAFDKYRDAKDLKVGGVEVHFINDPDSLMNGLRSGQLDIAYTTAPYVERAKQNDLSLLTYKQSIFHLLMYDTEGVFAEPKVRQAICTAMDPQEIVDAQFNGMSKVHQQRMGEGQQGYNPSVKGYPHDVEAAKKLMAEAGNPKVSFTLPTYDIQRTVAELFRDQMKQIGVDVKLDMMTWGQYYTVYNNGKYPAAIMADFGDASVYDYYLYKFGPSGAGNPKKNAYPELDSAVERALAAPDAKAADKAWQDMTKTINDQALDCGFHEAQSFWAYNGKTVDNVQGTPTLPSVIRYWELESKR